MMARIKNKPKKGFASELEEARYWEEHDIEDEGPADFIIALKPRKKVPVTLRLEQELITELKRLAKQFDVPYQTLARGLLHRGVTDLKTKVK